MAKKIIISYNSNPITTDNLSYNIYINNEIIPYQSGVTTAVIDYNVIPISPSLSDTIDFTVDYLRTNYIYNKITYQRVNDTIEILINYDSITILVDGNLSYNIEEIPTEVINLKYFIQYTNKVNDSYLLGIYGKNFQGIATEVNGKVKIEKGSIKDHLDPIRGTGLSIDLEATDLLTFEDLYSDDEQDYLVRLYKNGKIAFAGYLKPDGIFQSFTRDRWIISLDCVDGLGALENLSFVQDNGLQFTGKLSALDIVYYCLKRTGILLPINTSINIYYNGLTLTDELDILAKIQMNADRFFKIDDSTIMSCNEVLKSVLDIFDACITQQDGEWYIFKPNELYANSIVKFKRYNLENDYTNLVTKNLNKNVGSQIDNFYPHHCNGNQRFKINGGISAYRLGYKYGFVSGLLPNPKLDRVNSVYNGWTIGVTGFLINDPNTTSGFLFQNKAFGFNFGIVTDPLSVLLGDLLTFRLSWSVNSTFFTGRFLQMRIQVGSYYLKYSPANNQIPFEDAIQKSVWTTTPSDWTVFINRDGNFEFPIPEIPVAGNLTFTIKNIYGEGGTTLISLFDLKPTTSAQSEIGEFHTISRTSKISSIVKENNTVYNGDNAGIIYLGAIFKDTGETTQTWFRKGFFESKPILQIAAEEQLRIAQKPIKEFTGDFYGYLPYICVLNINNINGKFMLLEYSYDTIENITSIKALELFAAEIPDLIYKFTYDFGNTVKPTIIG